MALVSGREILLEAQRQGRAVGAFNFTNLETLQAIVAAAEAEKASVFLAVSEAAISYAGLDYIVGLARTAAARTSPALVLHLDHGRDLALIRKSIAAGFTSVMIDASHLPFEENLRITRQVVELAYARDVSVEAELGTLKGIEDNVSVAERDAVLVNPGQAQQFKAETGIDSLAPAIGTSHGAFKFQGEPRLDFERLKQVKALTGIPLVLHGASSVPDELITLATRYGAKLKSAQGVPLPMIQQAIKLGINKVNVDTDLRLAWLAHVRETLAEKPGEFDQRRILGPARDAMTEVVRARIRAFRLEG